MSVSRGFLIAAILALVAGGAAYYWTPSSTSSSPESISEEEPLVRPVTPRPASSAVERAIDRAVGYLDDPSILDNHALFYVLDFLERRFELGVWQSIPKRYASFRAAQGEPTAQVAMFRRLIEPDYLATPEELEAIESAIDRVTTAALYCREYPIGEDYDDNLRKLAMKGGYHQSHSAMAIQWLREKDCAADFETIESYVVDLMAAGVRAGDRINDIEIERAVFLGYLGHADRVPEGMIRDLVRLQNGDGGWSVEPHRASNWHPTFLALWFLLESEGLGNGAPMIVPKAH